MTSPKCPFSTQELTPCDNYLPVTIFWPCPEVVIISDNYCTHLLLAAAASKSAWPPEVSMPLSLSLPELLELASSDIPEELLEELQFGNNRDI